MQLKLKHDFSTSSSAQAIFETILEDRQLELDPPRPRLKELIKDFGLSQDDLQQTRKIIHKHLSAAHDILVYGDYDADGVTATAILYLTLSSLAKGSRARIFPFIPDRVKHGYGLSSSSMSDLFSTRTYAKSAYPDFSPQLIITVDNGIVAHSEVKELRERQVDVIITDHHQPLSTLPPANSLLHSTVSSGAGLAWVLSLFLTGESAPAYQLLELATLGIVADQLPLVGINRTLVIHGLKLLSNSRFLGIKTLIEISSFQDRQVTVGDINFRLAPRLNAAGRLGDATDALRLLCTTSASVARQLSQTLESHNQFRQDMTQQGTEKALSTPPSHRLVISASSDYHEGVIGLIAGRLVEHYHRPALAIAVGEEFSKGSARSLQGINIIKLLREFSSEFVSLGGHELAAGFTLKTSNLSLLTKKLEDYADQNIAQKLLSPRLTVEGELLLSQTTSTLASLLSKLAPFGLGNPKPLFVTRNLRVLEDRQLGQHKAHRRLTLEQAGVTRQAIWFNPAAKGEPLAYPLQQISDLVYSLDINEYKGKQYLQLVVKNANL